MIQATFQQGWTVQLLSKVASPSDEAEQWRQKGRAYHRQGRLEEALECFDNSLAAQAESFETHHIRGIVLSKLKRFDEALESYETAIFFKPNYAEAHLNKGNVLFELGRFDDAIASYDLATSSKPDFAMAHYNRGTTLSFIKRFEEALTSFDAAISIQPDYPEAYYNRGKALHELNRFEDALASYDKALCIKPDYAQAHYNKANLLRELKRFEEAVASYQKALAIQPNQPDAHNNCAVALVELKRLRAALASYEKAIILTPDYADAHYGKGICLLLQGRFRDGFRYYEWRKLKKDPRGNRRYPQPLWLGDQPIAGRTILAHHEQGLGDTIQFCRYVLELEKLGAKVLFAPQKQLTKLMETLGGGWTLVEPDTAEPFDFHCPLLSLPLALKTNLENIPAQIPYLFPQPDRVAEWKRRIGDDGFKIGICWQGSTGKIDVDRSFPVAQLLALSQTDGVRLISLHKGAGEMQLENPPSGLAVETLGQGFDAGADAFLDTAAVMACCDLVITSDTSIAHLAGALGVPTWVALKYVPDWRWMLDRSDSPWYPSARLFRQTTPGDWEGVFAEITSELNELLVKAVP